MSGAISKAGLADLARQINAEHDALLKSYGSALDHARLAGTLLIDAKAKIPHGAWAEWIRSNCRFSDRAARVYVQIARDWPKVEAKRQSIADLSLAKAIEIISPPKPPKPEIVANTPKCVTITANARDVSPPARASGFSVTQLRREPKPEERDREGTRNDLAEYIAGSIRAWLRSRPEFDADAAVELAVAALAFLQTEIENGGVNLT